MNEEIRFFLSEGPHTVADLARLTGRSQSGIRLILKQHEDELATGASSTGAKTFFIKNAGAQPLEEEQAPAAPANPTPEAPAAAPTPAKGEGEGEGETAKVENRGRKCMSAGKKLVALTTINPRRPNTHGFKSMQVLIDNPAISPERFVELGGRLKDLRHDIKLGRVQEQD